MSSTSLKWKGSLCWCCRNAYDGCAWSRHGSPVKGWSALRKDLPPAVENARPMKSFFVLRCPEFSLDGRFERDYERLMNALRQEDVDVVGSAALRAL